MRQVAPRASVDGRCLHRAHRRREEQRPGPRLVIAMPSPDEAADHLREQATCCRRLARNSRTELGSAALLTVASQFEVDAFRLEREARTDPDDGDDAPGRLRAALARQDQLWPRMRPRAAPGIGALDD